MDWDAIREIFNAAIDLHPSERESYVRTASRGSEEMYSAIGSLLKTEESLGGFLEKPFGYQPPPQAAIRPGDLLCQRFRIQRLIGEGGMGHVYEAWDIELGRPVALKAIRPEIAQQPEALKRFRREVSVALAITHPNVCRTFDIKRDTVLLDPAQGDIPGNSAEIIFLTMEFLPGETLAARIARDGAVPLDQALSLATQIGEALTCAHNLGIYHRDIKPANVMLVPVNAPATLPSESSSTTTTQPRAVLTDFGLARQQALFRTDDFSAFSHSGAPIGTLSYMAPEQLEGKPTSAATDVYAFGLVLHEMVTGQRVFPSSNPLSHLAERLNAPAPSPRRLQPNLPEAWHQAIEGCLRLDPTTRFQSATEVLTVLHGGHVPLPTLAYSQFPIQRQEAKRFSLQNWSRTRKLTTAIISLVVMSLFAYSLRLYKTKADAAVTPGALVYMTQVKNDTGEKSFDNLSELMQAGLTQSAHINLLDQGRVGDLLQQMTKAPDTVITEPIAREIAMRAGAVRVIFPKVTGHNGSYKLDIDIQQPDNTPSRYREHWPKTFAWQTTANTNPGTIPEELLSTIRNTSDWIRKQVGESANDIARLDTPPEDVTTSNWEALENYERALELHHSLKTEEAILFLKKAVVSDPTFALAYGRLGDFQVSVGATKDGLSSYSRALDLTELQRLTLRERDRIRGLAAADSGDFEAAERAFRDYTVNYEHDYLGWFYLGYPLMMLGRTEEGLADIRKSFEINPTSLSPAAQLGMFEAATDHYNEAKDLANHLNNHGYLGWSNYVLGLSSFLEGNYSSAKDYFTKLQNSSSSPGRTRGTSMLAHLAAEQGNKNRAIEFLDLGIVEDSQKGNVAEESAKLIDRAAIESESGSYSEMFDDIKKALNLDRSPSIITLSATILGRSFKTAPPTVAIKIRQQLSQLNNEYAGTELGTYSKLAKLRLHANTLLANGQWENALSESRKASVLDAPVSDRAYLAFFLLSAADHVSDAKRKRALMEEAYITFANSLQHTGISWKEPHGNLPGFHAEEMTTFLQLTSVLHKQGESSNKVRDAFLHLRRTLSASKSTDLVSNDEPHKRSTKGDLSWQKQSLPQ